METSYDEDLLDNTFFHTFQNEYKDVFLNTIAEGCIICVPRVGALSKYTIALDDILSHVLIPSYEMPESHFTTLNGREVKKCNKVLTMEYELGCHFSTHILFEETYYTEDMLKYKVLCIEHPLEPKTDFTADGVFVIRTLRDCMDMLWIESGNKNILEQLDRAIEEFLANSHFLENASLQTLKDSSSALYAKCLQIALKDYRLKEKASSNFHMLKNVKISVEAYVQHGIYDKLFKCISEVLSYDDSKLNKVIRNSVDIQVQDLEINETLHDAIPTSKQELKKIDGYSTVLGKISCIRKMLSSLAKSKGSTSMLAADDILPAIIYVVIKTQVSNWLAHLTFLKQFHFSSGACQDRQEEEFLITTLEAAIEHIRSGAFLGPSCAEGQSCLSPDVSFNLDPSEEPTSMSSLFLHVSKGNLEEVKSILEKDKNAMNYSSLNLCHPLCICDSCHKAVTRVNRNMNPTVQTCDDAGLTALHIAAMYGQSLVLDYLLTLEADTSAADLNGYTPLHHAALRGHQTALLLLSQCGADINSSDNSLNTPLHLCSLNGHEGCVKALIYHSEYVGIRLYINAQNINGDTPLHNAAKWGYLSIVSLLLEYQADPSIINRRKISPIDVSTNPKVSQLLLRANTKPKKDFLKKANFDFIDESPETRQVAGEKPNSADDMKKVDKMLKAISYGDLNLACFYLGLDVTVARERHCHPLCASPNRKIDSSSCAVQGLSINICNADGFTALHMASAQGCLTLTQLLISNGAWLDVQTRVLLCTPLILACQNQRVQVASLLLEAKCNLNMQDNKGNTALHYAAIHGNTRLVTIILAHKPNLSITNRNGKSALKEAEEHMAFGVISLLKEQGPLRQSKNN